MYNLYLGGRDDFARVLTLRIIHRMRVYVCLCAEPPLLHCWKNRVIYATVLNNANYCATAAVNREVLFYICVISLCRNH